MLKLLRTYQMGELYGRYHKINPLVTLKAELNISKGRMLFFLLTEFNAGFYL